jgi:HJR/Mrr/RecB family endonuclease
MKSVFAILTLVVFFAAGSPNFAASDDDLELARLLTVEQMDRMHGLTFEAYVCRVLESRGYLMENIRGSNDYGVDAIATKGAERIAIQIKRSKHPIDRRAISDAMAGREFYKCQRGMVITNATLTESARQFATEIQCAVVERDEFLAWVEKFKQETKRPSQTSAPSHPGLVGLLSGSPDPLPRACSGPRPRGKASLHEVAAGRGLPVNHFARAENSGEFFEHEGIVQFAPGHAAG